MSSAPLWSISKSNIHCPFSNLAWEENLLRGDFPGDAHLFFYRNKPSIVLGRFQVPWREINFVELFKRGEKDNISVVRRRSGGGTVYHDLGNWNFCIVRKTRQLKRLENLAVIKQAVSAFGIELHINERFDLLYQSNDENFKVSGCAFKQKRETSLHHGTLLVNADLGRLKGVLGHPQEWEVGGKGIASHPSAVCNIGPLSSELEFDNFFEVLRSDLRALEVPFYLEKILTAEVAELKSWEWKWGETPHFSVTANDFYLEAKKGVIQSLRIGDHKQNCLAKDQGLRLMDEVSRDALRSLIGNKADLFSPFYC